MDEARIGGELAHVAGNAVIEAQPDADDEIGFADGVVDIRRPMHAGHTQVQRVRIGEAAYAQQRRDHRNGRLLGKGAQFRICV